MLQNPLAFELYFEDKVSNGVLFIYCKESEFVFSEIMPKQIGEDYSLKKYNEILELSCQKWSNIVPKENGDQEYILRIQKEDLPILFLDSSKEYMYWSIKKENIKFFQK